MTQQQQLDLNVIFNGMVVFMVMVAMAKIMGDFFEPPHKPRKHLPEPVAKVVIVPGGSSWQCVECGRALEAGEKAVKLGAKTYCVECARRGNPDGEREVTSGQLRYIAILCQQLKITTHYEERVKSFGEAGVLIRELEEEREHRAREAGRRRVKSVLEEGDITEAEAVTKELREFAEKGKGSELREVVITEIEGTVAAHIPNVRAAAELTRIDQAAAASFDLEPNNWLWFNRLINQSGIPRVGTLLLDKVLEYCGEKNYSIVNQVNAYGDISQQDLEDWYIRKGFTPVDYEKYGNALLKWVPAGGNPNTAVGTCYEDAWRYLIKQDEGFLVHGSVQLSAEGLRVNHAWVEFPAGYIWEPQTGQYFAPEDFKITSPIEEHRYTVTEAAVMAARTGKLGPWTDEERATWLGRR